MSSIPALRRETAAMRCLHHTIGYGVRKFKGRVASADWTFLGLAYATSRELSVAMGRHTEQITGMRPPTATWPMWRRRGGKNASETCLDEGDPSDTKIDRQMADLEAQMSGLPAPPSLGRTLRPHVSDESTALPDDAERWHEDESVSSFGACERSQILPSKLRLGRRQKARQRRQEFEEASRSSFLESVRCGAAGSQDSWAMSALSAVLEGIAEDGCDAAGSDEVTWHAAQAEPRGEDSEDDDNHGPWRVDAGRSPFLEKHAGLLAQLPSNLVSSYVHFRDAALEAKLDSVDDLCVSIRALESSVTRLEEVRTASAEWDCPQVLELLWDRVFNKSLRKPYQLYVRMRDIHSKAQCHKEDTSPHALEMFRCIRNDLEYRLEDAVRDFECELDDFEACQQMPVAESPRTVSSNVAESSVAASSSAPKPNERSKVQDLDQAELQALLTSKLLKR